MKTDRLNAFTDAVLAIAITIMVLDLKVPANAGWLKPELTLFGAYALSFLKVGIYWSQHHHMLLASRRVSGRVMLANLFFLFWLSLMPFVVRWIGEAGVTRDTVIAFGVINLACTLSSALLLLALVAANDPDSPIAKASRKRTKGNVTILAYVVAIGLAFVWPLAAVAIYFAVAALWLVPDKRIEQLLD